MPYNRQVVLPSVAAWAPPPPPRVLPRRGGAVPPHLLGAALTHNNQSAAAIAHTRSMVAQAQRNPRLASLASAYLRTTRGRVSFPRR